MACPRFKSANRHFAGAAFWGDEYLSDSNMHSLVVGADDVVKNEQ